MKINHVLINNWEPPGDEWWENVRQKGDEQLIVATISMTLSWNEYSALLERDGFEQEVVEPMTRDATIVR